MKAHLRHCSLTVPLILWLSGVLFLITTALVGCGLGRRTDHPRLSLQEREQVAVAIATDYVTDHDLDRAKARLAELGVANPVQWIVFLSERYIAEGRDASVVESLIALSQGLGVRTQRMTDYLVASASTATPAVTKRTEQTGTEETRSLPLPDSTSTFVPPTNTPVPMTETPVPPFPTPTSTVTPVPSPFAVARKAANVRSGPGTNYPIIGAAAVGDRFDIVGRNGNSSWWQICCVKEGLGWIYAPLVDSGGNITTVALAAEIPPPPPTDTPAPTPTPVPSVDFRIISQRMWSVQENGGSFDGPSLHCGYGHDI
ncbi:TPA: SH3 domain-containing protein, partial [Candidatus Bipolaricaulota bacterium]|nr:SH3 domain-containing protein [Candidatus Bipolaricaulota bacterium]